ncbi:MAG: cytochrome P450 [Dehalococcoidia bacterium]|nr:cytochrome P450 [Dehalococcoidia bacterium]
MDIKTSSPELDEELVKPANWGDEAWVHAQFEWLRANDPLRRLEPNGFDPFWNITKYHDLKEVEQNKSVFINDPRPTLGPKMIEVMVEHLLGRKHLVRSLVQMDDPDHTKYRLLTQGWFGGPNLRKLQNDIDNLAQEYIDRLADLGGECDFVKDVAAWYPLRVIMTILGIPEEDEPLMLKLTQELFGSRDPDVVRTFEPLDTGSDGKPLILSVVEDFETYFTELSKERRKNPTDDLASVIANAKIDGDTLPELETSGYYTIIATAGHDTTSATTSGGLLALIENPEEFDKLKNNPHEIMPTFIDETIRWVTPVRHFMRTATQDYWLRDTEIQKGDSLILWYPSANRDEEVFDSPFNFKVDRNDTSHIAFGFGSHVCLGQHLAKMEMSILFEKLINQVDHIELAGEPQYTQSTFVGGLKSLPIRYRMKK